ncbi:MULTISPECIES: ead/Ea22-like family protein [Citrobacter freundii complex]|uniref:ead/Ea22-like family protein n=1 Tax=Citrobacter freundii complex TaxID=1344959 RepID=UPI001902444F|nr:ead/Ea22-like family protein [Citrobacter freundii]MBJ8804080.1 ead/Ea22-like family protein [Citrobacter freundii]HEI9737752.1 ead/Ea22-like family protein [Citrobacter freundii]
MTALNKQALREAAEKATPGEWKRMMRNSDELMTTFHGVAIGNVFVELTTGKRDIFDAEFIAAANPATVLALLDELEAAQSYAKDRDEENQDLMLTVGRLRVEREASEAELNNALCELLPGTQYMDPPDGGSVTPLEQVRRMVADYRERISNLESRKVCVPRISNDEFWLSFNNRIFFREETYRSAVIKSIEAAGIGVKGE